MASLNTFGNRFITHKRPAHFKSRCGQMLLRLVLAVEGPDLDQPAALRMAPRGRLCFNLAGGL
jgi:hypothetical protein